MMCQASHAQRSESRLLDVFDPTIFGAVFADVRGREALEELLDRRTDLLQSVIDETLIRPTDPTRPDDGDERADDVADALPRVKTVLMLLSELEQLTNEMWIGFADVYADRVRRLSHHAEDGELVPAAELVPAEETS